jgi:protein tyrosine phosphatase (PTP) superfamily phosphohydrolase (DUF442 family)
MGDGRTGLPSQSLSESLRIAVARTGSGFTLHAMSYKLEFSREARQVGMNSKKLLLALAIAALAAAATFRLSSKSLRQAQAPEADARQQAPSIDPEQTVITEQLDEKSAEVQVALGSIRGAAGQELQLDEKSAEVQVALPLFRRVDEHYLRGKQPARGGVSLLKRMGIKTIVDLRSIYDHTDQIGVEAERLGLRYYWLPMSVWDPPTDQKTAQFLSIVTNLSNAPLYIFCVDGVNRTGEMTAIYRIAHHGWKAEQAIREMDEAGFNPYYWTLRNYVWDYARRHRPEAVSTRARKS